ncbi:MAG: sulfurtransferase, partial [Acidimicrobiales bacterium]
MSSLVDTTWLADHLEDEDIVILEVSTDPPQSAAYFTEHIPRAHYRYWKDLCWHDTDRDFPTPEVMADRLGKLGVGDQSTIVVVGDPIQFGSYAFWVLTMTGFGDKAVLLDGGRAAWIDAGHPSTSEIIEPRQAVVVPGPPVVDCRIARDEVRAGLGSSDRVLLDMRAPEEYSGERVAPAFIEFDHGAQRHGRIPGARHLYYQRLLTDEGKLKPAAELRAEFQGVGALHDGEIVT